MLEENLSRGERLYLRRWRNQVSSWDASRALGVDHRTYLQWERDEIQGAPEIALERGLEPREHYVILRFRARLTVSDIAKAMGCTPRTITLQERGTTKHCRMLMEYWGDA